jgi:hypothetical protein
MDKREFIKQVYQTVWGPNASPRQFIIDGIKKETYTYEETIEKIEAMLFEYKKSDRWGFCK